MLSSLRSYWDRLRAGRVAPYRAEIDPRQFEPALENMFIIEKLAPDNMRIRLAGMKICEMMGMEVRGMQPAYLIDEADRARFDRLLNVVMGEPAVVELRLAAPNRAGTYRATMLLMPLRSDFGDINRVIGCTSGEGDLFNPPLAFAIEDVAVTPVEPSQGAEVRQAKRDCRAFIAFQGNWERRAKNWEPLVAEIERASQPPMAVTARTALGIVKQMPGGPLFREDGLDDLVRLTRTLETQASVTSAAVPDCGP